MIPMIMVGITAFTGKNGGFSLEAFEKAFFYKEVFLRSLLSHIKHIFFS